jgi:hypothetical protein
MAVLVSVLGAGVSWVYAVLALHLGSATSPEWMQAQTPVLETNQQPAKKPKK